MSGTLDALVYAQHGRELMGLKSPVCKLGYESNKSARERQLRRGNEPREGSLYQSCEYTDRPPKAEAARMCGNEAQRNGKRHIRPSLWVRWHNAPKPCDGTWSVG
jgi:hypothetical protein